MALNYLLSRDKNSFKERFFSLNYTLIILVLIIGIVSCFAIFSTDNGNFNYHTKSHIFRLSILFPFFILLSFIKLNFWYKNAYLIYAIFLVLLISVEFFGITISGSKRWLPLYAFNLQPSELMKIALIVFLAKYYHRISYEDSNKLKFLLLPFLVISIPMFLTIRQPDLGTALLIGMGGLLMVWLAGLKIKYFVYMTITFLSLTPIVIIFLKPYQKLRILTFLNPERDPLGAGYQIIQSKIAIGSGGLFGKGFLQGTQSYLDYLPEKHTDFIFTLFSEEFGFVGSATILFLYTLLIYIIIKIGIKARSHFAKYYCFGFAGAIFIYIAVNMSMVLGLLPIVGSPLPIMSYGGSSMLAIMLGLSLVMSCHLHKEEIIV